MLCGSGPGLRTCWDTVVKNKVTLPWPFWRGNVHRCVVCSPQSCVFADCVFVLINSVLLNLLCVWILFTDLFYGKLSLSISLVCLWVGKEGSPVCTMIMAFPWMFGALYKLTVIIIFFRENIYCIHTYTYNASAGAIARWHLVILLVMIVMIIIMIVMIIRNIYIAPCFTGPLGFT